jgi:hypothetical protein
MRQAICISGAVLLLLLGSTALAQSTQPSDVADLGGGFKMRSGGGIDIGGIYCEVVIFGTDWKETESHDVFTPQIKSGDAGSHVASGTFTSPAGSFNLTETVTPADGGIHFAAEVTSDKEVDCNELSLAFDLPVALVGGKQVTIDGEDVTLPMEPAKKGESHLYDKEMAQTVQVPTPDGMLTISGNFTVWLQDDREWGDQRYGLRIQFSPSQGGFKEAKLDLGMKMTKPKP